jgi:hypothetical protein
MDVPEMTENDLKDRDRLVTIVQENESAIVYALDALRELRDRKLFTTTHKTFTSFCEDNFHLATSSIHRMLSEDKTAQAYSLPSRRAGRELNSVPEEHRETVVELAKASDGGATSTGIHQAWDELNKDLLNHPNTNELPFRPQHRIDTEPIDTAVSMMTQVSMRVNEFAEQPIGAHLPWQRIKSVFRDAIRSLRDARPSYSCYLCSGNGCRLCRGTGWVTEDQFNRRPEEFK